MTTMNLGQNFQLAQIALALPFSPNALNFSPLVRRCQMVIHTFTTFKCACLVLRLPDVKFCVYLPTLANTCKAETKLYQLLNLFQATKKVKVVDCSTDPSSLGQKVPFCFRLHWTSLSKSWPSNCTAMVARTWTPEQRQMSAS